MQCHTIKHAMSLTTVHFIAQIVAIGPVVAHIFQVDTTPIQAGELFRQTISGPY